MALYEQFGAFEVVLLFNRFMPFYLTYGFDGCMGYMSMTYRRGALATSDGSYGLGGDSYESHQSLLNVRIAGQRIGSTAWALSI